LLRLAAEKISRCGQLFFFLLISSKPEKPKSRLSVSRKNPNNRLSVPLKKKGKKKKENTFGFEGETKNRLAVSKHKRINKPAFGLEKLKTQR